MPYCREHWPRIREELLNGRYTAAAGHGTHELPRRVSEACVHSVNRRIRNRTYGGVGAGGG
jgi:hypothetical protein